MVLDDEMAQAALKIQSTFRGHKSRKEVKSKQDETKVDESNTIDNVDDDIANMVLDEEMAQAALKIQSTFRGHKVRKETKKADDENADEEEKPSEEEQQAKTEEEPPKEEEPTASSSTEKSAQQLQDEEDIANIVMDDEMEKTALKIQSAFRGKIKRKTPKDDMESVESSAEDGSNYEGDEDKKNTDESLQKSEESPPSDMYDYFGMSANENASDERGNSYEEADYNNFATSRQSYSGDDMGYSIDHFDVIEQRYDETIYPDDDINLMQGGGIFVEPSCSRDSQNGAMCASSDEDKEPNDDLNGKNNGEKTSSNVNDVVDEETKGEEKLGKISEEKVIESFDFEQNKDTAEALYYSLKKSEIEAQKRFKGDSEGPLLEKEDDGVERKNMDESQERDEDDDDVVMLKSPSATAKILKYGMSMDDRLLGSILSQDYSQKPRKIYPDDGFDPLLEETMRCHPQFLQRLHEMSQSGEAEIYDDNVGDDEDQFDDFFPGNIRAKIMASSISIADSDCFDPTNNKSIIDDDTIRTALETIHSTDSESTIASAATKIQAGERGHNFMTRRNNNQYSSIGNAAIDKSLDDFIQSQELLVDRFDEEPEMSPPASRKQESNDDTWTSDTCTESDKKHPMPGIIGIKLEQKQLSHFLTIDERRRTLHREDAVQRNSTRSQEEDSSKSSSSEKIIDKANLQSDAANVTSSAGVGVQGQSSIIDTEIVVPGE
jgi:IQ calmodulin-binding motif